ncbi:MAG: DUF748 domain-containing protein [Proteobacteria bacterium]|nr:DUF748 domain-containing protein [Pseudomonadota bacterium]
MELTRRQRKILIWVASLLAAYTFIGFLILPYTLKAVLLKKLPEALHREVSIASIRFNPYNLKLTIRDFSVKKRSGEGDIFSFEELYVNVESLSILKMGPVIKEVRLTGPYVGTVRDEDGSYSFFDLIPEALENQATKELEPEGRPRAFSINNIQVFNGSLDFEDIPKHRTHVVSDLTVMIPFISNLPKYIDTFVLPAFSATVNGTPFDLRGNSKPFADSHETSLDVKLSQLDLAYYATYSPVPLGFSLSSALMDLDGSISYVQYIDKPAKITLKGLVGLNKVELTDSLGKDLLGFDSFSMNVTGAELFTGKVSVAEISVNKPYLNAVRGKKGRLNLNDLLPEPAPRKPASAATREGRKSPPLKINIDTIQVHDASLAFSDTSTPTPFKKTLSPVDVSITGFSTRPKRTAALNVSYEAGSGKAGSGEAIKVKGPISINPVKADLKVSVKQVDISPVRSYVDEMLRIIITSGKASATGRVKFAVSDKGPFKASYSGDALLSGFSSISKVDKEDFLKWDTLAVNGIDASYSPNELSIDGVALSGFYSRLMVNPDGVLNVQEIVIKKGKKDEEETGAPAERAEAPPEIDATEKEPFFKEINIDAVTLQGGHINFTDRHIKPGITIDLLEMGGRVSGLKSIEDSYADVNLLGKFGKYAPIEITGRVNPLAGDLFVDLKLDFEDFDLSSMSPYSGKYVGYEISKGKLILDLDYLIEKGQLKSTNSIVLDQITFGQRVESPDATKLPVRFALNLLKNRQGAVELDIPVSGSLDDPEFKVGGVIMKLAVNFIVRAVSSPFALLGAIIGGDGEELSYAEFDPGSVLITELSVGKLDNLTEALFQRPGLRLEIRGYVDSEMDALALRDLKFLRSLKAEKLAHIIRRGGPVPTLDEVVIEGDEYEKYLWKAYKKMKFPKPKNLIGLTKKLPPEELKKLMLANTTITEDDLYDLAKRRAGAVKDYILAMEKVESERIYMVRPEKLVPEERKGVAPSRVEFALE